jgi:hypothetical protein
MTDTNGSRGERLQIMLSAVELEALDDFRFAQRMPTRAAAVRELLKRGLAAEGYLKNGGRTKSSDFGVLASRGMKPQLDAARAKRK